MKRFDDTEKDPPREGDAPAAKSDTVAQPAVRPRDKTLASPVSPPWTPPPREATVAVMNVPSRISAPPPPTQAYVAPPAPPAAPPAPMRVSAPPPMMGPNHVSVLAPPPRQTMAWWVGPLVGAVIVLACLLIFGSLALWCT